MMLADVIEAEPKKSRAKKTSTVMMKQTLRAMLHIILS